ncbi:HalOD1 output domain-containing protein [Haloarcula salina]|uniref:HalOD1 output domain-containing protein n=1 Tax=Haloarcula salina TaxID=1429914 RepID=UPI003C6F7C99
MSYEDGTVYVLRDGGTDGDGWVSPRPADEVITDAIVEATDLQVDDLDDLETYVDTEVLRAVVVDGQEETVTFAVEGHDVTIDRDGAVEVGG